MTSSIFPHSPHCVCVCAMVYDHALFLPVWTSLQNVHNQVSGTIYVQQVSTFLSTRPTTIEPGKRVNTIGNICHPHNRRYQYHELSRGRAYFLHEVGQSLTLSWSCTITCNWRLCVRAHAQKEVLQFLSVVLECEQVPLVRYRKIESRYSTWERDSGAVANRYAPPKALSPK